MAKITKSQVEKALKAGIELSLSSGQDFRRVYPPSSLHRKGVKVPLADVLAGFSVSAIEQLAFVTAKYPTRDFIVTRDSDGARVACTTTGYMMIVCRMIAERLNAGQPAFVTVM